MQAVLKAQINKTDRNDARGIAQMIRLGLCRTKDVRKNACYVFIGKAVKPVPPDDRGNGIDLMTSLNILSGGAAQGLVASLTPKFREMTGFDIAGEFGAVGAMADKLRKGMPADIVILTAKMIAGLAGENLVVRASISDVGLVETAIAVRASDPLVTVKDAAALRDALLAADAIFVPDTKTSTAGIHVAKVLRA